jgi:hypothetical protein
MKLLRTCLAVLAFAFLAGPGAAQSPSDQIEGVIGAQIEAFRTDDFETAFSFASPSIRSMFGNPDRFGVMVKQGYPMVWRPDEVTYLDRRESGGRQLQQVMIRDGAGRLHRLEYQMIEGPDGWRINGVRILDMPQVGA